MPDHDLALVALHIAHADGNVRDVPDPAHIATQRVVPREAGGGGADRVAEARRQIAESAANVFAELGYADTTMEIVAARAGVSARTVYRHFGSKGALLAAGFAVRISDFLARFGGLVDGGGDLQASMLTALESGFLETTQHTGALVESARAEGELWGQWLWAAHRQQPVLARILCRAVGLPAEESVSPEWQFRAGAVLNSFVTAHESWIKYPDQDLNLLLRAAVQAMMPLFTNPGAR